jgi:transposase-like protein
MATVEVITSVERRRRSSREAKLRIVAELARPDCTVSQVARAHDIAPGQLFTWRRELLAGRIPVAPDRHSDIGGAQAGHAESDCGHEQAALTRFPGHSRGRRDQGARGFRFRELVRIACTGGNSATRSGQVGGSRHRRVERAQSPGSSGNPGGRSDRPAEFREFIRSESAKYTKIVEITGITLK